MSAIADVVELAFGASCITTTRLKRRSPSALTAYRQVQKYAVAQRPHFTHVRKTDAPGRHPESGMVVRNRPHRWSAFSMSDSSRCI